MVLVRAPIAIVSAATVLVPIHTGFLVVRIRRLILAHLVPILAPCAYGDALARPRRLSKSSLVTIQVVRGSLRIFFNNRPKDGALFIHSTIYLSLNPTSPHPGQLGNYSFSACGN